MATVIVSCTVLHAQSAYTDKGHWLGGRVVYVPSPEHFGALFMYEYRFDKYWSAPFDLTGLQLSHGFSVLLAGAMRLRLPLPNANKNIYAEFGLGSGSMYPVLHYAVGFEYGITEKVAVFAQYRKFSPNFDHLQPHYSTYSIGVNFDVTPSILRQSYLLPDQ